ncbi:UDP-N-acetylglucosamine--N-acetylmuramyl-(pentapeptide) pyrophosphoryl-undecaprenol N-acetylglucosamine transferase [bacterium]|jgi:UDP-N-acetylglucosamine--N-acetylmuramyl-(pentapeptide) pyrophosphoryl-undecaprenol N-acetylglucosamine transferase|nr:UDP-N-acetylglucosamine--N-acetylmuramyl-(pentapeptide) pyrophosphoryl-undecaprenol N-acetylglucosamine transferase [bacterium]
MKQNKYKKILLVGGGTLGSVSPLLAVAEKYPADYLFVGTSHGPEKNVVASVGLEFKEIVSGKLRRYFSWQNFVDIFKIKLAFWQSLFLLIKFKPDIVLTAGSFVAVPVVWAAWLLRIPVIVHQQDIGVGLANKLMAPVAKKISVTFDASKHLFKAEKVIVTGNPVRVGDEKKTDQASIVITGGGLGARNFNQFLEEFIPRLTETHKVYHIVGAKNYDQALDLPNYQAYKFLAEGMTELLSQADIIISRAGLSLTTEAAALKKALIIIPIPDSHQEDNAKFFAQNNAAIMVRQGSRQILDRYLNKLLPNKKFQQALGENLYNLFPKNPVDKYIKLIEDVLK